MFREDWKTISQIYQSGIDTKIATFETKTPKWKRFKKTHLISSSLVAQLNEEIVGFATLSSVSHREVYKGVAEVSIYISHSYKNKGIGQVLLKTLIKQSEEHGFWTLQASIFTDNIPSIELHKKCGFRIIGTREKIAQRDGKWHDNVLMEKRSEIIN